MKISAVIITFNEEKRLGPALKSVEGVADEIVVVDSYSTDDTVKLARRFTDKVHRRRWTNYADQKNYANEKATHAWILSLDADERLSPRLREEILALKETEPKTAAFSMPRLTCYLGRWIRHSGWYPDRKLRLFRRDRWGGPPPERRSSPLHLSRYSRPSDSNQHLLLPGRQETLRRPQEVSLVPPGCFTWNPISQSLYLEGGVSGQVRRLRHRGPAWIRHLRPLRKAAGDLEERRAD
jgi:glycosyltransferase involved in cell wall biosynthesis